jgi:hypothetical protein
MKQNITISIEKDMATKARVLAAKRNSSISRLLSAELTRIIIEDEAYEKAMKDALNHLDTGYHLGGSNVVSREELHAR